MRGKTTPLKTKASAVGLALMTSGEEASRQTGIPGRTIRQWMDSPEFAELRQTPREVVGDAMWVAVQEAVQALRDGIANPKSYLRDKVAAFEALVEKRALIMGEATVRSETRTWTDDLGDDEKRRLRAWIDGLDDPATAEEPGAATADPVGAGSEVR